MRRVRLVRGQREAFGPVPTAEEEVARWLREARLAAGGRERRGERRGRTRPGGGVAVALTEEQRAFLEVPRFAVAAAVLFLAGKEASYVQGVVLNVDGGQAIA